MADGQSDNHVPVLLSYSSFSRPSSVPSGSGYEVIISKFLSVYGNQMGVLRKCMIQLYSDEWGQYIDLTKGFTISEKCKLRLVPLQSDVTTLGNIQKSPATPGFFCFDIRAESSCSPGKKPITRHASGLPKMPMVCRKYEQRILEKAKLMCEMDTFHNKLGLHVTVQPKGITPRLEKCHNCCRLYHCPFCKPVVFKPTFMSKVLKHLDGHKRRAVQHKDHTILKCNLECRDKAHFHCPYCKNLFDRRNRFIDHLVLCGKRIHSTEALREDEGVRESEVGEVTVVRQSKMKEVVEQAAGVNPLASEKEKAISTDTDKTATKVVIAEAAHKNRVISKLDATVATAQVRRAKKLTVACPRCAVVLNKKNVKRHMERKHSNPCHA